MQCDTHGPKPVIEPLTGPGGPACDPDRISTTSGFTGRVPSQWINAFRFLGLASEDGSFLEDFRSGLARAVTQHYVEAKRNGVSYGFLGDRAVTPGTYIDGPMWMHGFYDSNNLFRLLRDTGDAPLGNPALPLFLFIQDTGCLLTDSVGEFPDPISQDTGGLSNFFLRVKRGRRKPAQGEAGRSPG